MLKVFSSLLADRSCTANKKKPEWCGVRISQQGPPGSRRIESGCSEEEGGGAERGDREGWDAPHTLEEAEGMSAGVSEPVEWER